MLGEQKFDTTKIHNQNVPSAIVMAVVQYFCEIGANAATIVLKMMKKDIKIGKDLRHFLADSPNKLPQVSKSRCLAYILHHGKKRID